MPTPRFPEHAQATSRLTRALNASTGEPLALDAAVKANICILIVEDDGSARESCANVLRVEGYHVSTCAAADAEALLRLRAFEIVLIDSDVGAPGAWALLQTCVSVRPQTVAIVMTQNPTVASSIATLAAGAWDYLPKPFSAGCLQLLIGRAAHVVVTARESKENGPLPASENGHSEMTLLGVSPAFRSVIQLARKVAPTDASVFLSGESGSGKEQIAQFVHTHSRRSSQPFLAVNCAALPEPLLESEMFGHVKGAFTGAVRDKAGLLEAAHGGTLFLDELTEMPLPIQAKLLRVLQDGVVRRVGSNTQDTVVNVRFIAATNRDVKQATESGHLRLDLYYRLRVVPIRVPPLRERPEDVPLLAHHFLLHYWSRHRAAGEEVPWFGDAAIRSLQERKWPGNVRELQNVIEHAVVLLEPACEILPGHLPSLNGTEPEWTRPAFADEEAYHSARERIVTDFERSYLKWLVARARGNMSKAARIAKVDRTTLYRLIEKHGLQRETVITIG